MSCLRPRARPLYAPGAPLHSHAAGRQRNGADPQQPGACSAPQKSPVLARSSDNPPPLHQPAPGGAWPAGRSPAGAPNPQPNPQPLSPTPPGIHATLRRPPRPAAQPENPFETPFETRHQVRKLHADEPSSVFVGDVVAFTPPAAASAGGSAGLPAVLVRRVAALEGTVMESSDSREEEFRRGDAGRCGGESLAGP